MLPKDIEDALNEQRAAILQTQGPEACQKLQCDIDNVKETITKCTSRYQRRRKLDLLKTVADLEEKLKNARSGKILKDFEEKIKPMLDVYHRLSKNEPKVAAKLVRFSDSKDSEIVLEMRRCLIDKFKKTELQHALLGDFCDDCGVMMLVIASDSLLGCPKCAKTRAVPHASATSSMESDFVPNGSIKIKSRLLEWVQFSQAKECVEIDEGVGLLLTKILVKDCFPHLIKPDVIERVKQEVEKGGDFVDSNDAIQRLKEFIPSLDHDMKRINGSAIRRAMQSLVSRGYGHVRKLYENSSKYGAAISGFWPRRFSSEQEDRIRRMFTLAAPVYHSDRVKSSTLTFKGGYPYWLRCVCILNGWYEFLDHFQVKREPRSSEREVKRSEFWNKLKWEVVPSHSPLRPQLCVDSEGNQFEIRSEDFETSLPLITSLSRGPEVQVRAYREPIQKQEEEKEKEKEKEEEKETCGQKRKRTNSGLGLEEAAESGRAEGNDFNNNIY